MEGKKIYEAWSALDWDKGKAIFMIPGTLRRSRPQSRFTVVSLGDDFTYEDGFKVVKELDGIAIRLVKRRGKQHIATAIELRQRSRSSGDAL